MLNKWWVGVIIIFLTSLTVKCAVGYFIVGEEHLTSMQSSYMHAALGKPCNGRIIVLTPYPGPRGLHGSAAGPLITVWSVWQHTPLELYCLMRHECRELQRGEEHTWDFVWRECQDELWRYKRW